MEIPEHSNIDGEQIQELAASHELHAFGPGGIGLYGIGLHGFGLHGFGLEHQKRSGGLFGKPNVYHRNVWIKRVGSAHFAEPVDFVEFTISDVDDDIFGFTGVTMHEVKPMLPGKQEVSALTAAGSPRGNARRVPPWFDSTVERMAALMNLPQGWSGYEAGTVDRRAVAAAMQTMLALDRSGPLLPSIVPTREGGVQLEWHLGGVDLEVQFESDGAVELWYSDDESGQTREDRFERRSEAVREIDALLAVVEARL